MLISARGRLFFKAIFSCLTEMNRAIPVLFSFSHIMFVIFNISQISHTFRGSMGAFDKKKYMCIVASNEITKINVSLLLSYPVRALGRLNRFSVLSESALMTLGTQI